MKKENNESNEVKEKKNKGKKPKNIFLYIIIILLLILIAFLFISRNPKEVSRLQRDLDALAGVLPGKSLEEIQRLLNEKVEEGMVNVSINPEPTFANGRAEGSLGIENIPGNHYALQVDIQLNDTGEVVYQSGLLDPGFYINKVKLNKNLSKGDYPATAIFTAYYVDEQDEVLAKVNVDMTLHILN
ncbi:MAG: hypothetical protein K2L15_01535 [Eubacteriales bacterium]|nr:hypothetical protein [Eubacteriales bacterium]